MYGGGEGIAWAKMLLYQKICVVVFALVAVIVVGQEVIRWMKRRGR